MRMTILPSGPEYSDVLDTARSLLLDRVSGKLIFLFFDSSFCNLHADNFYSVKAFLPCVSFGCNFLLLHIAKVPFDFQNLFSNLLECILSLHFSGTHLTEFSCTNINLLVLSLLQDVPGGLDSKESACMDCWEKYQQSQPYIYMYPFSPKLASHPGCHITLSRVPCVIPGAIQ